MKKALSFILFLALLLLLVHRSYQILEWKDTTGGYVSSTQQLYHTEDNLIDVVFSGSSHCYCGIYPELIWEEYGYSGFDMSISGMDKDSTVHTLIELCKNQKPKVVFVDIYCLLFERHAVQGNVYRNMLSMKISQNSIDLVKDYVEKEEQADYILRWPIIHTRYRELEKYDFVQYDLSVFGRGSNISWHTSYVERPAYPENMEAVPLSEENLAWIKEIQQLSEEYDFEPVMMLLPCTLNPTEQAIVKGAEQYLEEQQIPFLNFNSMVDEIGLDYAQDFMDSAHLNARGAEKISSWIGRYLNDNYELEDHRSEEAYYLWERSTQYYHQLKQAVELSQTADMQSWLAQIQKMENITLVVSLDGQFENATVDIWSVLEALGIPEQEWEAGGKWIISNREITDYHSNQNLEIFLKDLGDETLRIQNYIGEDGECRDSSILLGRTEYWILKDGLNIVVYDEVQKKVLEWRGYFQ